MYNNILKEGIMSSYIIITVPLNIFMGSSIFSITYLLSEILENVIKYLLEV